MNLLNTSSTSKHLELLHLYKLYLWLKREGFWHTANGLEKFIRMTR